MKLPILPRPGNILEARYTKEQMREYALKAMAQEREACARIAWNREPDENGPIETAIRARGQK